MALTHPLQPGTVIAGKYRIERLIGQGGMAAVYLARHDLLQRDVAIKLLSPELTEQEDVKSRFLNEARAAARLRNEHVAAVMDVETAEGGTPFIVLEYLEGEDLEAVLSKRGPLPYQEVVDWTLQALEAIAHAHAEKIIHRDLKPANLFLTKRQDGTAVIKVLDFGLSKVTNSLQGALATKTTAILGSPAFMSPEQLRSAKNVDARADLWSVGVILFHMVTGKYPLNAESEGELFAKILADTPLATIRSLQPDVPEALDAVFARCVSRDLAKRYANAAELAQALGPLATPQGAQSVERICRTLGVAPPPPPAGTTAGAPLIAFGNHAAPSLTETTVAEAPQHPLAATTPKPMEAPKLGPLPSPPKAAVPTPPSSKPANQALITTVGGAARRRELIGVLVVVGLAVALCGGYYAWTHTGGASAATEPKPDTPAVTAPPLTTPAPPPVMTTAQVTTAAPVMTPPPPVTVEAPTAPTASAIAQPHPHHVAPAKSADLTTNPLLLQRN